ncbi:MAG: transcriptional repressor LexA [Armatimonadota bacterium]|nr:transcriptional repressor LexA [bacterium]
MGKQLTARQREVLNAIKNFIAENGYPPSIRELRPTLGISSLRGVTIHLDALERKGWIQRARTSRSIRVLSPVLPGYDYSRMRSVPVLGTIAAGIPLLAVENVESYVSVPANITNTSYDLFALRVHGDSMCGDHILDGDTIIIRKQESADHGQIVAALISDEATVKRLDSMSSPPRLLPSNPAYDPIVPEEGSLVILGTLVGLIRSYESALAR